MIKHLWLDFSDTIAFIHKEEHDKLRYATYAEVTGRNVDEALIAEFESLHKQHAKSNSAVFRSLGLPAKFWSDRVNTVDARKLYRLAEPDIPEVIQKLKDTVPVSIFSNIHLETKLPMLGISMEWFTHVLSADVVKEPKPSLEGFYKMVELSSAPAEEIFIYRGQCCQRYSPCKTGRYTGRNNVE